MSTEVVGSTLVKTSSHPFFQPEKATDDGRPVQLPPAGAGGDDRRERAVPSAAASSADQLAGDGAGDMVLVMVLVRSTVMVLLRPTVLVMVLV